MVITESLMFNKLQCIYGISIFLFLLKIHFCLIDKKLILSYTVQKIDYSAKDLFSKCNHWGFGQIY